MHKPTQKNPYFLLTSVSAGPNPLYELEELSTEYIYCVDLQQLSGAKDVRYILATDSHS